jgi:sporulation protein YlmC with PRC-barrel domain
MSKPYLLTDDGVRIALLSRLDDFHVADGYVDVRGWEVASSDGRDVGRVHDLLVDLDGMRTRYLEVRLHPAVAAVSDDRDVLVPVGSAQITEANKRVVVPLAADRIALLPAFDNKHLLRTHESEIRRHFSLGEAAAAVAGTPAPSFYDHEAFDDRKLFMRRPAPPADVRAEAAEDEVTRIPVADDETVVLRKSDDGQDEIIVRRPRVDR